MVSKSARRRLSRKVKHFMQMLDWGAMSEPKMVYLGLVDKEDYTYYKSHPDKACERN